MEQDYTTAAKVAYFALNEVARLRNDITQEQGFVGIALKTLIDRYNEIFASSAEALKIDKEATQEIRGLTQINANEIDLQGQTSETVKEIYTNLGVLQSVLESFIAWHLPVEKQRTIGFRKDDNTD